MLPPPPLPGAYVCLVLAAAGQAAPRHGRHVDLCGVAEGHKPQLEVAQRIHLPGRGRHMGGIGILDHAVNSATSLLVLNHSLKFRSAYTCQRRAPASSGLVHQSTQWQRPFASSIMHRKAAPSAPCRGKGGIWLGCWIPPPPPPPCSSCRVCGCTAAVTPCSSRREPAVALHHLTSSGRNIH